MLHLFDEEGARSDSEKDPQLVVRKVRRTNYDRTQKFQMEWEAKMLWAEGILSINGSLHLVRCRSCSIVDSHEEVMAPKWDMLCKYEGLRCTTKDLLTRGIKKGDIYVVKTCRH